MLWYRNAPIMEHFRTASRLGSSSEYGAMASGRQNLVGARVRKLRMEAGLSQDALSARCQAAGWDVSRGTFAKIEAGLRRVNDAEILILAKVMKLTVSDLLDGFLSNEVAAVLRQGETTG